MKLIVTSSKPSKTTAGRFVTWFRSEVKLAGLILTQIVGCHTEKLRTPGDAIELPDDMIQVRQFTPRDADGNPVRDKVSGERLVLSWIGAR